MTCPNPELLAAAVEGRLDPAERDMILNHAALCDECRHSLLVLQAAVPVVRPVARPRAWIRWAAAAAVVLTIAGILLTGRANAPRKDPAPTTRAITNKEPVQPEPPAPNPVPPVVPPEPVEPKKTPAPPTTIVDPQPPAPPVKPTPEPPVKPEEPPPVKPPPTPEPPKPTTVVVIAILDRMEGEVLIANTPARAGQAIRHGESVETRGARSWALVSYPDKTRMEIEGDTLVRELLDRDPAKGRRLFVERGAVRAEVTKQPAGQPMVFDTPHGEARVLGTTLRVVIDPDPKKGTRLEVEEGKVELRNLAGKSALVESGHFAIAAAGASPTTKRMSKEEVLVALDFEDGKKPAIIAKGTLERGPDRRLCWAGEPDGGGSGFVLGTFAEGLLTFEGDEVVSFDYWADLQASAISLQIWNRTQRVSHEGAILKVTTGKWARASMKLSELGAPATALKEGDVAASLVIRATGSAPKKFYVDNLVITRTRSLKPRPVETK